MGEKAKEKLITAAKKLEKAQSASAAAGQLKQEEKSLVNEAYKVRDMPEGKDKEEKKTQLVEAAKALEKEQEKAVKNTNQKEETAKDAKVEADETVEKAKET